MTLATPVRSVGNAIIDHVGMVVCVVNAPNAAERAAFIVEAVNRLAAEVQQERKPTP